MDGFAPELCGELLGERREESLDVSSLMGFCSKVFHAGAHEHIYTRLGEHFQLIMILLQDQDQSQLQQQSRAGKQTTKSDGPKGQQISQIWLGSCPLLYLLFHPN